MKSLNAHLAKNFRLLPIAYRTENTLMIIGEQCSYLILQSFVMMSSDPVIDKISTFSNRADDVTQKRSLSFLCRNDVKSCLGGSLGHFLLMGLVFSYVGPGNLYCKNQFLLTFLTSKFLHFESYFSTLNSGSQLNSVRLETNPRPKICFPRSVDSKKEKRNSINFRILQFFGGNRFSQYIFHTTMSTLAKTA